MEPEQLSRRWVTAGVRLSVFPIEPWTVSADLWEQVLGAPPETDQNQPRQRVRVQTGPWHEGVLQLTVSPFNVVWLAAPPTDQESLPNPNNWRVADIIPDFLAVTRLWLSSIDFGIKRVGFGLHSLLPAQDKVSAYRLLQGLVPSVTIEPETTSEFFYQINRPVPSRVLGGDVRLNRLMKWSATVLRFVPIQIAPHTAQANPLPPGEDRVSVVRAGRLNSNIHVRSLAPKCLQIVNSRHLMRSVVQPL